MLGSRFPLYVGTDGLVVATGAGSLPAPPLADTVLIVLIGLALTLLPLQTLQWIEGGVDYSNTTIFVSAIYFRGALSAVYAAVRAPTGLVSA